MNAGAPFGGGVFIADKSAWGWLERLPEQIKAEWDRAVTNNQIATSPVTTIEILYSAQSPSDFDYWAEHLWALRVAVISHQAYWAAVEGYRELAHGGRHRKIPFVDILTGATATAHNWGVLHYDEDYDDLACLEALNFESRWIAPQGTL